MGDVLSSWRLLAEGVWVTVQLTVAGSALALALALIFGLAGTARSRWIRGLNRVYVEFFRGTATLVLMYWFFYSLPLLGLRFAPMFAAILALGLNVGAYGAEVVRGSLNAVPRAQYEATVALNFTPLQRMRRVLLPQAVALMLPPFGNLLIELMKGSAIVSLITISDLTFRARQIQSSTGETLWTYVAILVLYFVIAQLLLQFVKLAERRVDRMLGRAPVKTDEAKSVIAASTGTGVSS